MLSSFYRTKNKKMNLIWKRKKKRDINWLIYTAASSAHSFRHIIIVVFFFNFWDENNWHAFVKASHCASSALDVIPQGHSTSWLADNFSQKKNENFYDNLKCKENFFENKKIIVSKRKKIDCFEWIFMFSGKL